MRKWKVAVPKEKVDRPEWDFTLVPQEEERACCFYEYARESEYIVKQLEEPFSDKQDSQSRGLQNSPLTYALPQTGPGAFTTPWLAKDAKWRATFCQHLAEHWEGLSYARILEKTPDRAFDIGIQPHFPWQQWSEEHTRLPDKDTGLELLLVTIDWSNFDDSAIIKRFCQWIKSKEGRPPGIGLRDSKGKRTDAWRKKLERLAILRLRHYHSVEEMAGLLPDAWYDMNKFLDVSEVLRECRATQRTLLELFPFLPKNTKLKSSSAA